MAAASEIKRENRAYQPRGAVLPLFYDKSPEILVSGPAGTGKSRGILEKLHLLAEKYAGSRLLMLRKTRESLSQAALVTFEQHVVPAGHPILNGPQRNMRQSYRYPNGSEIVVGGLDKSQKVMSTEYDVAYIQEAIEVDEVDWENVTTRLRNGVIPYQQILADTNPGVPTHWLYSRAYKKGKTKLYESTHVDNPVLWDEKEGTWTPFGLKYMSKLDALTGPRFHRLRHGKWVGAEGQIYDTWDPLKHVIRTPYDPPKDWPRIWSFDFGYKNPFVWQCWVLHPDNILILWREIYQTKLLVEDGARMIRDWMINDVKPVILICDHDAEDRATLKRHLKLDTRGAYKDVANGIQAVQHRLKLDERGVPGLQIMANTLIHKPDEELEDAKRPTCTLEEVDGYVWDERAGQNKGDAVLKENDHGMDVMRYTVAYVDKIAAGGTYLSGSTLTAVESRNADFAEMMRENPCYGYRNAMRRANKQGRYRR